MPRDADAVLAAIDAVAPRARDSAAAAERAARLAPDVVDALIAHRLLRLWLPEDLDGDALDLAGAMRAFEAASRVDGAFGWTVTIGVGGNVFAGLLDPEGAREIFGPREAVVAGSGAPSGRAAPVVGGYRAGGRWRYASGAPHATWFTANCVVEGESAGSPGSPGADAPIVRAMAFPASDVEVLNTWNVSGLRATSSHDFSVADRFVPAHRTFSVGGEPRIDAPLYRYPFAGIAQTSFACVGLGIARHAIDAFVALAREKRSSGGDALLRDRPGVAVRVAEAEATLRSARAFLFDAAAETWRTVCDGGALDAADEARVALAGAHAAAASARATELLYAVAGMTPLFMDSELGRCWRDAHAVTQNAAVAVAGYDAAGRALLEG